MQCFVRLAAPCVSSLLGEVSMAILLVGVNRHSAQRCSCDKGMRAFSTAHRKAYWFPRVMLELPNSASPRIDQVGMV